MGPKKRRLQDLYITGREVALNDDSGQEPIVVWLQKLNAIEAETAGRRAGAARSRVLMASKDQNSEEWQDAYNDVAEFARETLVEIVISDDVAGISQRAQAEIAAEEKWTEKDYLQGLYDSWSGTGGTDGGLRKVYEAGDEDHDDYPEAKRVFSELQRYNDEVSKRVTAEREALRKDLENEPMERLREDAVKRNLGLRGDAAWIAEFRRSQVFFGTRDPENHKERYFSSREEVDELAAVLLDALYMQFDQLAVEVSEGKDLPPTPDSSPPSEQSDAGETAASSGPVAVTQ